MRLTVPVKQVLFHYTETVKRMEQFLNSLRLEDGEAPFYTPSLRTPLREATRWQEEKMERKLIVTLIGIGLIVLVMWLSSGCSVV